MLAAEVATRYSGAQLLSFFGERALRSGRSIICARRSAGSLRHSQAGTDLRDRLIPPPPTSADSSQSGNLPYRSYPSATMDKPNGSLICGLIRQDRNFAGVFYWSPEWYDAGCDAFALFGRSRRRTNGIRSFKS